MNIHWAISAWIWPLLLVGAAGAVVWTIHVYRGSRPRPSRRRERLLTALRSAALLLLLAAVAGPVLSRWDRSLQPAELLVVIEDSGSMALADAGPRGATPRWDDALAVVDRLDSLAAAGPLPVLVRLLRGNGIEPLREFSRDDAVVPPPLRQGTDLAGLQRQLRSRLVGGEVRAVVLLADGQETTAGAGTAADLGPVPLHAIGLGDVQGPADRLLADVRAPDVAYRGDEVVIELAVVHRLPAEAAVPPATVRLSGPDGLERTVEVPGGERTATVELSFVPRREGLLLLELEVSPLPEERHLENNRVSLALDVRKERSRVLLLTGRGGWDVRFLAQAARSEPRLRLDVVYPGAQGLVLADSLRRWDPPREAAGWSDWEGVVLQGWTGDVAALDWAALAAAVDGGLGLLVLPPAPTAGPVAPPPPPLAALLPVTATSWTPREGSFFLDLLPGALGHPVLSGAAGRSDLPPGQDPLAGLPPLRSLIPVEPLAGAEVLLQAAPTARRIDARTHPVLVLGARGGGRVTWFGGSRLWELAFWAGNEGPATAADDQPARRLLRNLLVWTAEGRPEAELTFTGNSTRFPEGRGPRLEAAWRDMRGLPVTGQRVSVTLRSAGDDSTDAPERTFTLAPLPTVPGAYADDLPPLPPGAYTIQLTGHRDPPVTGPRRTLVVEPRSLEATQTRQDRRRLTQLAALGGGRYLDAADPAWAERLGRDLAALDWSGQVRERRVRLDPWSGWPFLAAASILLGLEWFLRRRSGLL